MLFEGIKHTAKGVALFVESLFDAWGIYRILYHETNREALTLCSALLKSTQQTARERK